MDKSKRFSIAAMIWSCFPNSIRLFSNTSCSVWEWTGTENGDGENRITLIDDNIHPNALGYAAMAALWREVLSPGGTLPLVLEGLCIRNSGSACQSPMIYKQNYLATGDEYYRDRTYTLTSIPAVLEGGVSALRGVEVPEMPVFTPLSLDTVDATTATAMTDATILDLRSPELLIQSWP